jgi:O-antigen biosynthesis protein
MGKAFATTTEARDTAPTRAATVDGQGRPRVRGKSLFRGDTELRVRGVTYGPFAPRDDNEAGFVPETVEADFAQMARSGINAVRLYAVPPRWLLDAALRHGLLIMVGLSWEQHVTFLSGRRPREIEQRVREAVRACSGHPAILCYAVGNEIPAPIVRWYGRRRIERFIERLYRAAKQEDPGGLVTYVNFPSTEYLRLPFLDLACFNIYLERPETFDAYLARLQNLADDLPLIVAEIGLDSRRNGPEVQALSIDWQVRLSFAAGCAGVFVFAWTDEWHRGGYDIDDWDFGLTSRERQPKPALGALHAAFDDVPFTRDQDWPGISVVICTRNGERTLPETLAAVAALDYPDYEVVVVSDGSTDSTPDIARRFDVVLVETEEGGLARARNRGLTAATHDIVAYVDDDARPDPHWLAYIAAALADGQFAGVGGPNLPPPEDGAVAQCVAHAPGGPTHVLISDREAEHIPGCNMAFRRECLEAIDGFDPQYHAAGDDVDVCWRMRERGFRLGFSPGAVVLHHRRDTVGGYLAQQRGYGKAEALLERKWPERYSAGGHVTWRGRLYGNGAAQHRGLGRWHVYYGAWGTGLFQSIYQTNSSLLVLPLMPEWYLVIASLVLLSGGAFMWSPLWVAQPLLVAAVIALLADAALAARRASFPGTFRTTDLLRLRSLTAALYLLQPLARLYGRLVEGLTPWRWRGPRRLALPLPRTTWLWSEHWESEEERVRGLLAYLRAAGAIVLSGGDYDRWDIEVRGGMLGSARTRLAVEEHGAGRQLVRTRWWPRFSPFGLGLFIICAMLLAVAAVTHAPTLALVTFGVVTAVVAGRLLVEAAGGCGAIAGAVADAERNARPLGSPSGRGEKP